jgi:5-methylcytosine-specific restriction endonuclease McrA
MLTCQECGEEFYEPEWKIDSDRHSNKYCGAECRHGVKVKKGQWKVSTCEQCGEEFKYFTSHKSGEFCSHECYWTSLRPNGVSDKPTKECQECGQEFDVSPSKVDEYKFCSEECRKGIVMVMGEPIMKRCRHCGTVKAIEDFQIQYSKSRESAYRLKTCRECRYNRRYSVNGQFSDEDIKAQWHQQNGECFWSGASCGKSPSDEGWHIDHLTPRARGEANPTDNPRNLVIACAECNISKGAKLPIEFKRYRLKHKEADKTYSQGCPLDLP